MRQLLYSSLLNHYYVTDLRSTGAYLWSYNKDLVPIYPIFAAVGYRAVRADGKTDQPNAVLEALIDIVRPTGGIGVPGLYMPNDPSTSDPSAVK